MKVLHIGKYFPPYAGGMETFLRDIMAAQARQGLDCATLVHRSEISYRSTTECYKAQAQMLPVTRTAVWARLIFTPLSPTFPFLLRRMIKKQNPDILHLHMPNASAFWALLLPCARQAPWVVQWQSDVLASKHSRGLRFFYALYRPLERALLQRSAAIIVSSPPYLASSSPLKEYREKCHVLPLGLNPCGLPDNTEQKPEQSADQLKVLAVGRLTYYKGFEFLIRAAAQEPNVLIELVGTGEQEAKLKALALRLGLQERVTFHGHLSADQLAAQFRDCDCLCLPSIERTESFGMVVLEAMYCRRAVIASDVAGSGMGWLVEDGVTGLITQPEDVDSLARALRTLSHNRDNIRLFGENGRERFNRHFHIDKTAAQLSGLYGDILDNQATQ